MLFIIQQLLAVVELRSRSMPDPPDTLKHVVGGLSFFHIYRGTGFWQRIRDFTLAYAHRYLPALLASPDAFSLVVSACIQRPLAHRPSDFSIFHFLASFFSSMTQDLRRELVGSRLSAHLDRPQTP
jgi:hypothetical protein